VSARFVGPILQGSGVCDFLLKMPSSHYGLVCRLLLAVKKSRPNLMVALDGDITCPCADRIYPWSACWLSLLYCSCNDSLAEYYGYLIVLEVICLDLSIGKSVG